MKVFSAHWIFDMKWLYILTSDIKKLYERIKDKLENLFKKI